MAESRLAPILGWLGFGVISVVVLGIPSAWVLLPRETIEEFRAESGLQQGIPEKHLLPEAYVGWVIVRFEIEEGSALSLEDGIRIYRHSEDGLLETSSPWNPGFKRQEYFYDTELGWRQLGQGQGAPRIWGETSIAVREYVDQEPPERRYAFFVGTQEQYRQAGPVFLSPQITSLHEDLSELRDRQLNP